MASFPVVIEQDDDGVFVAECPTLPGCITQGSTEREVLERIREVIESWLIVERDTRIRRPQLQAQASKFEERASPPPASSSRRYSVSTASSAANSPR